jgi:hypothetical protein
VRGGVLAICVTAAAVCELNSIAIALLLFAHAVAHDFISTVFATVPNPTSPSIIRYHAIGQDKDRLPWVHEVIARLWRVADGTTGAAAPACSDDAAASAGAANSAGTGNTGAARIPTTAAASNNNAGADETRAHIRRYRPNARAEQLLASAIPASTRDDVWVLDKQGTHL